MASLDDSGNSSSPEVSTIESDELPQASDVDIEGQRSGPVVVAPTGFNYGRVVKLTDDIEFSTGQITQDISNFVNETATFADEAKNISKRWRETSLMLTKHSQLLEFLEVPQMMDTCVRNGCYEEALKLAAYVQKLRTKYGSTVPLIENVAREAALIKDDMVKQLLKELRTSSIQLPYCLKLIGYLRRAEEFNETELKFMFLNARDCWLQSLLQDIPNSTPLVHLSKLIETYRVNLFDIATQYKAVFPPDDSITAITFRNSGGVVVRGGQPADRDFSDATILSSWFQRKKDQFLEAMRNDLMACVLGDNYYPFESIIDPCLYFGLSMSRIGADIRPELMVAFQEATALRERMTSNSKE